MYGCPINKEICMSRLCREIRCRRSTRSSRGIRPSRERWVRRTRTGTEISRWCRSGWHCSSGRGHRSAASCYRSGVAGRPARHAGTRPPWSRRCGSTVRISATSPDRSSTTTRRHRPVGGAWRQRPASTPSFVRWYPATTPECFESIR